MEFKTLILGLFMSTAAFAIKAGGGLAYLFLQTPGWRKKILAGSGFAFVYGLVFALCALILLNINLTTHLDWLQTFFKSGMTLHFTLAIVMAVWGVRLLLQHHEHRNVSKAWLLLVIPCPVCFGVILLSCSFVAALFPESRIVFVELYAGFVLISLVVAVAFGLLVRQPEKAGAFLGMLMLYIAGYFMLSVIIMPQFADLEKVYRISTSDQSFALTKEQTAVLYISLIALATGFAGYFFQHLRKTK